MAITRAQQAKQMLQKGGRIGLRGGGADMGTVADSQGDRNKELADRADREQRETDRLNRRIAENRANRDIETVKNILEKPPIIPGVGGVATKFLGNIFRSKPDKRIEFAKTVSPKFLEYVQGLEEDDLTSRDLMVALDEVRNPLGQTYGDFLLDKYNNPTVKYAGDIGAYNRDMGITGDGPDQPIIPIIPEVASTMDQETLTPVQQAIADRGIARAFVAEGGIMNNNVVGGEMDFESARQMYGLGKLVKKATRAVKKIAKSPIGKAALLYTVGFGIPGTSFGGLLGTSAGSMFGAREGLFGTFGPTSALKKLGIMKSVGDANMAATRTGPLAKLFNSPLGLITATSAVSGLLTAEQEEEAQRISDETGIDIAEIRANPSKYLAPRFAAEGGIMRQQYQEGSKEPVAKKTMPLLDMGGMEKDYREDGGFVPIGRMEKADDVPARLSKNEFVFTADAVRNAGDGDVDKGAEVMYNMMKNLEAGGDVSEESQGLEGAREMFQTSKRLEEVL